MRARALSFVTAAVLAVVTTEGHAAPNFCAVATDVVGDATFAPGGSSAGVGAVPSEPALDISRGELLVTDQHIAVRLTLRDLTRLPTPEHAGHSYFMSVQVQGEAEFGFTADVTATTERGSVTVGIDGVAAANGPEYDATVLVDEAHDQVTITARVRDLAGSYLGPGSRVSDPFLRTSRMAVVLVPGTSRTTAYLPADYTSSTAVYVVRGRCRTV